MEKLAAARGGRERERAEKSRERSVFCSNFKDKYISCPIVKALNFRAKNGRFLNFRAIIEK